MTSFVKELTMLILSTLCGWEIELFVIVLEQIIAIGSGANFNKSPYLQIIYLFQIRRANIHNS